MLQDSTTVASSSDALNAQAREARAKGKKVAPTQGRKRVRGETNRKPGERGEGKKYVGKRVNLDVNPDDDDFWTTEGMLAYRLDSGLKASDPRYKRLLMQQRRRTKTLGKRKSGSSRRAAKRREQR